MRARFRHLVRNERGESFTFVGVGFMTVLTATTLAIDVGVFTEARNQARRAARAGALAGAAAMTEHHGMDRTARAVQRAIEAATASPVLGSQVSVRAEDVGVQADPDGRPLRVRVSVYRTRERNNPVRTATRTMFGLEPIDVEATAMAEVVAVAPADGPTNGNGNSTTVQTGGFPNVITLVH